MALLLHPQRRHHTQPLQYMLHTPSLFLPPLPLFLGKWNPLKGGGLYGTDLEGFGKGVRIFTPAAMTLGVSAVWVSCVFLSEIVMMSTSGYCK